jgi:hypothetical protein
MQSKALLDRLDERYKALNRAIHGILHLPWGESDRVILTAYPPLAVLGDGRRICPDGTAGMDVASDFSLSQRRAKAGSDLADQLQRVMAKGARTHGWSFATAHRNAFVGRGICAGFTDNAFSIADDLRVPRLIDGTWQPFAPTDYRAYASRQRWFRTPNDAFLTGNFHAAGSVATRALAFQSLARFQVLLAAATPLSLTRSPTRLAQFSRNIISNRLRCWRPDSGARNADQALSRFMAQTKAAREGKNTVR